ncbi:MAG TPA: ATP-binding cassette domain-containing protein [Methylomirabilota bacterium]|nr:ATP-binding cassette domain-containing protein [Methylomirabilota bacterium]
MLTLHEVVVIFGPTRALDGVTLTARAGERMGLVGPNGAGKTTLLDAACGLVAPASGRIELGGVALAGRDPAAAARLGVARTFQSPRLFPHLTVAENIRCGRRLDPAPWVAWAELSPRRDDLAEALTPGEARRLELARALAGAPRLLLLDEPCGGLSASETDAMATLIERAASPERAMIMVEHRLGVVGRLCARVVALSAGTVIFDGPPAALGRDPRVAEAYLGRRRPVTA